MRKAATGDTNIVFNRSYYAVLIPKIWKEKKATKLPILATNLPIFNQNIK